VTQSGRNGTRHGSDSLEENDAVRVVFDGSNGRHDGRAYRVMYFWTVRSPNEKPDIQSKLKRIILMASSAAQSFKL